jgi:hypothetical protein
MSYGEIFVGTFRQIWQHKKLWLFGLLATLLSSVGLGIYQLFGVRWQGDYMSMLPRMMENPDMLPRGFGANLMASLSTLWIGLSLLILFGLVGYIVSLVMRGAIIHEAATAWAGGETDTSRGVSAGVGRAVYVFLLDLLWGIVPFILGCGVSAGFLVLMLTAVVSGGNEGWGVFLALLLFAFLCSAVLIGLLLAVFTAIFPPLMYQSAVVGGRSFGAAVHEGWRLTIGNLGPMIIFWLLLTLLTLVLNAIIQAVTLPLTLPWMGTWMAEWTGAMEEFIEGGRLEMPPLQAGWLIVSGLVSVVLSLIVNSFLVTFRHTLYAEVYRRLTGAVPAVEPAEPPDAPSAAAPLVPVEPSPAAEVVVPDELPADDEELPRVG